ncbi:hypothetical protein MOBT1_001737 [Malassezia obtusa]|uniref:Uncharacterized protein n=1 Tax=Malassezia obtusa TaxID=76774 RepID=A0AAF0IT88_9BASI|nr:hypothetical protein MOBT1_001737 [Malassezia obtusa]
MKLFAVLTTTAALAIATAQAKILKVFVAGKGSTAEVDAKFTSAGQKSSPKLRVHHGASDEKFVFYECDSAPNGFNTTSSSDGKFGQVRSAKDAKKCLSVQGVDNRSAIKGGKYEKKNGFLTMEDCNESSLRLQWWKKDDKSNFFSYVGKKGDAVRDSADWTKDGMVYMYKYEYDDSEPFGGAYRSHLELK